MNNINQSFTCKSDNLLSVMVWNLDSGPELTPIVTEPIEKLPEVTTEIYRGFLATNFKMRAKTMARIIDKYKPDIIGLEEVVCWEFIPPNSCEVVYDYIEIFLNELRCLGLCYKLAQMDVDFNIKLPSSVYATVSFTDRNAIIVKEKSDMRILDAQNGRYKNNKKYDFHGKTLVSTRGWSFIDVWFKGNKFRVINTHLEAYSDEVQVAQVNEIVQGLVNIPFPIILIGDFNSDAIKMGKAYKELISAGFEDTWLVGGIGNGVTCCQDESLLNVYSMLERRIDLILTKNACNYKVLESKVLGDKVQDKTCLAQWPSDHAAVITNFRLPIC